MGIKSNDSKENELKLILLMFLSMIMWGGSWSAGKAISNLASPEVLVFWRFFISFIAFIPFIILTKTCINVSVKDFFIITLTSLILTLKDILFFAGLKSGLAGAGGVLVTTLSPLFTFIISKIISKQNFSTIEMFGFTLGSLGGLVLLEVWSISVDKILASGNLFFLASALAWSLVTIASQKTQKGGVASFTFSFYVYGLSSMVNFFVANPSNVLDVFFLPPIFWLNIFYLSLISTTIATTIYFFSSKKLGAYKTNSYMFLVPVTAVLISWSLLGETPKITTISGGMLTLFAIYLVNFKNNIQNHSCKI